MVRCGVVKYRFLANRAEPTVTPGMRAAFSSSPYARAYALASLASMTGSLQLAFWARLAWMGLGLARRWRALASHIPSATEWVRMTLCRRSGSSPLKACRKSSLRR